MYIANGVVRKNLKYYWTVEVTNRTASKANLYFEVSIYANAALDKKYREFDIWLYKILGSNSGYSIECGKHSYAAGALVGYKSFTREVDIPTTSNYYYSIGNVEIEFYYGESSSILSNNDERDLSKRDGGQILIPAYGSTPDTPIPGPEPTPTPTPTPTYNITASATSTLNTATITLKGLPTNKSCTIEWYLNGIIKGTSTHYSSSSTSSHTFSNLVPSTKYTLRGVVRLNGSSIGAASADATTSQETGTITLTATSRSVTAKVSGMSSAPKYTRTILVEIFAESTGYRKSATYSEVQDAELIHLFQGLQINTDYRVTATIKNGGITLKTLSKTVRTSNDYELLPTASIVAVNQKKGSTNLSVQWNIDRTAAKTVYTVEIQEDGGQYVPIEPSLNSYINPIEIPLELEEGSAGEYVNIRIRTKNEYLAGQETTVSEPFSFYVMGEYSFTTPKVRGEELVISAEEWNRLIDYTNKKSKSYGLSFDLSYVTAGDTITAKAYNSLKNAINSMRGINIQDKKAGNPISAADINALRTAINLA